MTTVAESLAEVPEPEPEALPKPTLYVYTERYGFRCGNAGDEASAPILRYLTGRRVEIVAEPESANIIAIGSVLDRLPERGTRARWPGTDVGNRIAVWGSALIDEDHRATASEDVLVTAVRGPLTLRRMSGVSRVAFGDPGIFADEVWPETRESEKRYRLGFVPHYVDMENEALCQIAVRDHGQAITVIDPCAPVRDVVRAISECEAIISSSLHGLVFAESLGIPNAWVRLSGKVAGGSFKFRDWSAAIGKGWDAVPIELTGAESVERLVEMVLQPWIRGDVEPMKAGLRAALVRSIAWIDGGLDESAPAAFLRGVLDGRVAGDLPSP